MKLHISEYVVRSSIVRLQGRVDMQNTGDLRTYLNDLYEAGLREFVIDLSQISFIDCTGLAVLAGLLKRTRLCGGNVHLVLPEHPEARRMQKQK